MTRDELIDELALPHIPGYRVRRLLIERGGELERARIIKLLEGIRADALQWDELGVMTKGFDIALDAIKGEPR